MDRGFAWLATAAVIIYVIEMTGDFRYLWLFCIPALCT